MSKINTAPRGTQDTLPDESYKKQFIEKTVMDISRSFGFNEIRTPVFENTQLFSRSVGDTTDVVQKEMYTFEDKGGRSITLRPEGTAGAVRSVIEHGLLNGPMPLKVSYLTSCYRYERPQAGRLREFHQFGVECFGSAEPAADVQIILLAKEIFDFLGVENISLEINSIGCSSCREEYYKALREYFRARTDSLCPTCIDRLEKNPMRILDCKCPECKRTAENAPVITDYLCEECKAHFEKVRSFLDSLQISYSVNPRIVRGLDYYTKTVFEFISNEIGAQGTICGGGRYDGLVEEIGGKPTPALGFGMGIERLLLLLEKMSFSFPGKPVADIYIASLGEQSAKKAMEIFAELTSDGYNARTDLMNRSLKAQLKYADKIGARYSAVIGENDLESGKVNVKNMASGEVTELPLDNFSESFGNLMISTIVADLGDTDLWQNQ